MNLTGQNIRHVNTITHDAKVLVFGTAVDGAIYYSIKRSGYENTALAEGADPFAFEPWQKLRLGESVVDASVTAREQKTLADTSGNLLLRSVYGNTAEVTNSADAPVQIVSALSHIYVFRQSSAGKILVSRFVLDGMTNELVPKLEVRFRRSKQRFEPQKTAATKDGNSFDNLDFRDIDGKTFFEPSLELSFVGTVANGWFAPIFVPTAESDRNRWHIFVYDSTAAKLVLYTVGADGNGSFDVKDYLYGQKDPTDPENTIYRSIPGIIRRTIDLQGMTVAGCPSATTYDIQKEQMTDAGPQLMRDVMRIMMAVPVKAGGVDPAKTGVIDFALAADGTLSQIDPTPDTSVILRSDVREVVTPLSLLDDIKEIANLSPPPAGTVMATERGADDLLQVRSTGALPVDLAAGSKVKIRGTQSYDGHYKVLSVDGATFKVEAAFQNNEAGFWEVAPDKQTGLVFDDMIVGAEKAVDGKLKILCPAHDLKVGDEVQISGTREYNGIFPITSIDAATNGFVLDAPFFTGEAGNLSKVVRRGLRMAGTDRVETPEFELLPPSPERDMGRTLSAWVRVDAAGTLEQSLIKDSGGLMNLAIGSDNKVKLVVRLSDGVMRTVTDPNAITVGIWTHFAGAVDYATATGGNTRISLCRDGVEVATKGVGHLLPSQFGNQVITFDGVDDHVVVPGFANSTQAITVSAWVRSTGATWSAHGCIASKRDAFMLHPVGGSKDVQFYLFVAGIGQVAAGCTPVDIQGWHLYTGTFDGQKIRIYVDGVLSGETAVVGTIQADTGTMSIGRDDGQARYLNGGIVGVEVWNRARTQVEIAQDLAKRMTGREPGLVGYWPLDNGTTKDMSSAKRHGTIQGNAVWTKGAYMHPQIVPPAAYGAKLAKVMQFDGIDDCVETVAFANPTAAITVSFWARSATANWNNYGCLVSKRNAFIFHSWAGDRKVDASFWIGSGQVSVTYTPADIQGWHLYTGTYDGTTVRFYIDGIQVGQAAASGAIAADASGILCIGRDDFGTDRYLKGQLADVQIFNVAKTQAEIQDGMYRKLNGDESGLVGYWPLDADAADQSPNKRTGSLKGNPALVSTGSTHIIGQSFTGEIAEAQIWSESRPVAQIKATMHLQLTGKEQGLEANYRMGAIVYEETPPMVPDFSVNGCNGIVYGDPYAGARHLGRATGSGMKVVQYGSDELVAVSQRAVYEESFEFKVTTSDAAFDPSNADGTGQKLFAFSYYGKSSRGSKDTVTFPMGCIQPSDFASLGSGWYKATCRVVVPDGISLMRAFQISDVKGKWGSEATPPANEWTAIDVRKHRIRMISDAVTRDNYTDVTSIVSLPAQSQTVINNLTAMRQAENNVARYELQVTDLVARIDVAQNNQRYVNEKNTLTTSLSGLQSQRTTAQNERSALLNDLFNYAFKLRVKHSQLVAELRNGYLLQATVNPQEAYQLFRMANADGGWFKLYSLMNENPLTPYGTSGGLIVPFTDSTTYNYGKWRLIDLGDGYSYIRNCFTGTSMDVMGAMSVDGAAVLHYAENGGDNQRFTIDKVSLLSTAQPAVDAKDATIASLDPQIATSQQRLDWLTAALAANESLASLQTQLTTAQSSLTTARTDLATKNTAVLSALSVAAPATMPVIATDDRDLETTGAVLDFAQPAGGLRLTESCEGNVLLTYFDTQGRMRATPYDATADSRNAAFEQWVPDAVRACADVRDSGDKITLPQSITLSANGYTCEAWVQYPVATKTDGTVYDLNIVAAADNKVEAPIAIRKGKRLGLLADGWFFDSGVDLERTLGAGWHHLAVSTARGSTAFYANGVKLSSRKTAQPALRFNGSSDYVEVPAHANPTAAITVSIWARSATANWNNYGMLVSKRDAFIFHPNQGTRSVELTVWINGATKTLTFSPPDIQAWHLYTATFDGSNLRFYVDGELVGETPAAGTIAADTGVMHIGHDEFGAPTDRLLNGDIAEVAIWNTARGQGDIRDDLYRSFKGSEAGLVGYWRMEKLDDSGVLKVKDLTSNARHGLIKGAPIDIAINTLRDTSIKVLGNASAGGSPIGRLAEVRLWNLGLTDAEIAVNARVSISGSEPGLIGYWPLDEATGTTAYDRSVSGQAHGSMSGVDYVGRTASIGNPGGRVLNVPDRGNAYVSCPSVAIAGKSFTFECWARRSGSGIGGTQLIATMGTATGNNGLHFGFRTSNVFTFAFYGNDVDTPSAYTDTDWHHWCGTYDQPTKKQRLYCDGVMVAERTATADFGGSGTLNIGRGLSGTELFAGDIAELRVWDKCRSETEIRSAMRRRLIGNEANLIAHYPMDEINGDNKVKDKKSGTFLGQLNGTAKLLMSTSLPMAGADNLITSEYSSVEISGEGKKQALMRRFYGFAPGGNVELLPEQRVEELTLQWVGNTQINPTLLGFIEGAPPIPSENLTIEEDYDGATTVTLTQSEETSYTWTRSETNSSAFNLDGFLGGAWEVMAGVGVETKLSEGQAGAIFNYQYSKSDTKDTSTTASSSLATSDSLTLTGMFEDKVSSPALGKRWLPKNVGYALVISGMADIFVTKLKRSGRMVSYDIRPVDGVPLDVNTITFMLNPAYTLNGSLDGMVGSMPADATFYPHVPEMRSQYGSLYPASYFRLKEAYALKASIDRQDKERESFFYNFDADKVDQIESFATSNSTSLAQGTAPTTTKATDDDINAMTKDNEKKKDEQKKEAEKKQEEIKAKNKTLEGRVRAGAAFSDWQLRMGSIQTKAGKRNIVNTYVWDGDGGLRAEEQSFASTIEHSISTETSHSGGAGGSADVMVAGFKFGLNITGSGASVNAMSKTLSLSKSLELGVDLSGVEKNGITDLKDYPMIPGEKVDRYRFMTFYLEGSTDHFADFFSYVVDPEWLQSNDEEARALRMARAAKPNKCWRVLHRVTYVERPALMGLNKK